MRILLTTILMLVCLVAYSATPSYSNFSSNQFAPSGTYTVTVKDQPLLTNIVEHAQLSLTNPAFADSLVYMTNMRSLTGLTNTMEFVSTYGPQIQFAWTTNGIGLTNTVMVISNGLLGVGVFKPSVQLESGGAIKAAGDITSSAGSIISAGPNALGINGRVYLQAPVIGLLVGNDYNGTGGFLTQTNGIGILMKKLYTDFSAHETATNTLFYSQGTNFYIGDGITANSSNVATMQFSFQTSGTPVMVISNGLVGIGKANPGQPFDVAGTANFDGTVIIGTLKCGSLRDPGAQTTRIDPNATSGITFVGSGSTIGIWSTNGLLTVNNAIIIQSNNFPITANFANLSPCGCVHWNSNGTMLLICTNAISGLCYTNKLGGL